MVWEAATGQRLWQDLGEATVMMRVLNGEIPSARTINPTVHPELDRICAKAMAHERDDRYATADELRRDLEHFIETHTNRVSGAELGKQLAQWFEQDRAERRRIVEAKLSSEESFTWTGLQPLTLSPTSPSGTRRTQKRRSNRLLVGAVLTLGVVAVGSALALMIQPSPPPAIPAREPEAPQKSLVRVTVFPDTATLFIDGKRVPENPYVREGPADRSWHTVRAEAPGHIAAEKRYRQAGDVDLVIALQPEPEQKQPPTPEASEDTHKARPPRTWHTPKPKPQPEPVIPSTQGAKCTPPYYFDDAGVKRFRPECL
jgi:serine/threonine-protein kinase